MSLDVLCGSLLSFFALSLLPSILWNLRSHSSSCRYFYLLAGDHQLSSTLLHSAPLALRLLLSLERAATSGEVGNQLGDSHSLSILAGFTCTVTDNNGSLCNMQIAYTHACTKSLSRQVITWRRKWGFISVSVEDGTQHPWALEGFNNSS